MQVVVHSGFFTLFEPHLTLETTNMLMRNLKTQDVIRVEDLDDLMNPFEQQVKGRSQAGEEEQDRMAYAKSGVVFPSGESLPRCWTDPTYRVENSDT